MKSRYQQRLARRRRAEKLESLLGAGMVAILLTGFAVVWGIIFAGEFL